MMSEQFNKGKQLIVAIILGILTYFYFWSHCRSKCCNEINDGRVGGHLR